MEDVKQIAAIFVGTFTSLWEFLHGMVSTACQSGVSPSFGTCVLIFILIAAYLGSGFMAATIAEFREGNRFIHFILGLLIPFIYPVALIFLMPKPLPESVRKRAEAEARAEEEAAQQEEDERAEEQQGPPKRRPIPVHGHSPAPAPAVKDMPFSDTISMTKPNATVSVTRADLSPSQRTITNVMPAVSPAMPDPTKTISESAAAVQDEFASDTAVSSRPCIMNQQYFASISVDSHGNHMGPFMLEMSDGRYLEALRIVNPMPDLILLEIPGEAGKPKTIRIPYSKILDCKLKSAWLDQR